VREPPNPAFHLTPSGRLRQPPVAGELKRWASHPTQMRASTVDRLQQSITLRSKIA